MSKRRVTWLVATTLVSVATSLFAAVPITEDGESRAVIVHNGLTDMLPEFRDGFRRLGFRGTDDERAELEASLTPAKALQHFLRRMTGAELELVATVEEAGDRPAIVLNRVKRLPGAADGPIGDQAFRIHIEGNRLFLSASTDLGLSHAVYGLLEDHLGCRFYNVRTWSGRSGTAGFAGLGDTVIPKRPTLELRDIDDFQQPSFANRGLIFRQGHYSMLVQNRAIGIPYRDRVSGALAAGHNMYGLLPPHDRMRGDRLLAKGLFADHPEIYPLNLEGERQPDTWNMSICGTAKALPAILAKAIIDDRAEDFDGWVSAGQGDGFAPCHCADCRRVAYENESEAAPLILALNRALEIIGKTHPNLKVITFSYFGTLNAPQAMEVHPNLWVNVVSSDVSANAAGDQMGPVRNNPANAQYARALRDWPALADGRVTVWHWDTFRADWPSMFYVGENMRYMHEAGVYAVNPQTCGGPWSRLINWLYIKLAWNIDADSDALIMQYLEDVFSKEAAPHLWDYLKLGQEAYEASLYVPSAVRWSGWTRMMSQKIFHEGYRDRMVELMDKAEAAAREQGTEEQLANLLEARDRSLDTVIWEVASRLGDWSRVAHDGRDWFVPGADPRAPGVIQRRKAGQDLQSVSRFVRDKGGPVVDITGNGYAVTIVPDLHGQIVSAVHSPSGKDLLDGRDAAAGYRDLPGDYHTQLWAPAAADVAYLTERRMDLWGEFENPHPDRLKTETILSPESLEAGNRLYRRVQATAEGVRVERTYTGAPAVRQPAGARWRLALPEPGRASLSVRGGGIREWMDLRYAEPGGIRFVEAGQRPPGYEGLDAMHEDWDSIIAISDADEVVLELESDEGQLEIELNRGDGLATVLVTPAAGWKAIKLLPHVGQNRVDVELVGRAPLEGRAFDLPVQTLAAREAEPLETIEADAPAAPRIRITGDGEAVNEADGAELVWVPAGAFIRGSEAGYAGADEGPVREVYLDGYWIYKHPVTLAQFKAFAEAAGRDFRPSWGQGPEYRMDREAEPGAYPVIINWFNAEAYAGWAGGSLPTEAQWEKAARGADGRKYPWGDEYDLDKFVSFNNTWMTFPKDRFTRGFYPVGSHPQGASPYGAEHMVGNTWEWTADWYRATAYFEADLRNPGGPESGDLKVIRGGSSMYDDRFSTTTARMVQPPEVDNWTPIGFRVVIQAPGPDAQP